MIRRVRGTIEKKDERSVVIGVGPVSLLIFTAKTTHGALPGVGEEVSLATFLNVREDALELYGFLTELELTLFEKLNGVSGIGPKSALGILSVAPPDKLIAAINEGKTELLTRASGVGKKTAERAVLELKGKLASVDSARTVSLMESDVELEDTLASLGFSRADARAALQKVDPSLTTFKDRLRAALQQSKKG